MAEPPELPLLERQLLDQLTVLERQIAELNEERLALQRFIIKVRHQTVAPRQIARRNSFDRILVEDRILLTLREAKQPIASKHLYAAALAAKISFKAANFPFAFEQDDAEGPD